MSTEHQDCGVMSMGLCKASGLTLIDRLLRLVTQAGTTSEGDTDRDGFLSHAGETHSAGAGLGAGFTIAASGELRLFGVIYQAVILGNRGGGVFEGQLLKDIKSEKPYFLGALVVGAVFGLLARYSEQVVAMPNLLTLATYGLVFLIAAAGPVIGWHARGQRTEDPLTFEEVARATAEAKLDRRADGNLSRDYVDGADGVLAELMARGYGDSPRDRLLAYQAGGDEVEFEEAEKP